MDKKQFIDVLVKNGIDTDVVCFDDVAKDAVFCVMQNYNVVEVFYRERGRIFDLKKFKTQSEALSYLLDKILRISGKI